MMSKFLILTLTILLLTTTSCRPKFVEITPFPYDPVLVANAFIEAGKPWEMHLSRTASFYENSGNLRLSDSANAVVTSDLGTLVLQPRGGRTNPYCSDSLLPQVGVVYLISITYPNYPPVEASMKIPPPGRILSATLTDSSAIDSRGNWVTRLRVKFLDPESEQKNYFLFTITAVDTINGNLAGIEFQTEDPVVRFTSSISNVQPDLRDEVIRSAYFITDDWFIDDQYTLDLLLPSSRIAFLSEFYPVWEIEFVTIDSNMYQYYESLHRQAEAYVSPYAEPVPVTSNILGGLGIWGGFSKDTIQKSW